MVWPVPAWPDFTSLQLGRLGLARPGLTWLGFVCTTSEIKMYDKVRAIIRASLMSLRNVDICRRLIVLDMDILIEWERCLIRCGQLVYLCLLFDRQPPHSSTHTRHTWSWPLHVAAHNICLPNCGQCGRAYGQFQHPINLKQWQYNGYNATYIFKIETFLNVNIC